MGCITHSPEWVSRHSITHSRISFATSRTEYCCRESIQGEPHMDIFVKKGRIVFFLCCCLTLLSICARAQEIPADYQEVLKSLDRKGDFKAGVLKVNIPRND